MRVKTSVSPNTRSPPKSATPLPAQPRSVASRLRNPSSVIDRLLTSSFPGILTTPRRRTTMKIAQKVVTAVFAAVTVFSVVGCASTSTKEGTGEYVDDAVLTTKVKASIFNEPSLKSTEINVETFKGTVQLSGFVAQPGDITKAGEIARGVKGVQSVKNDIRVK